MVELADTAMELDTNALDQRCYIFLLPWPKFQLIQIFKEYVSFPKQRDFSLQRAGYNFYTVIPTQKSIGSSKSMKFAFKKNIQIIQ